MRGSSTGGAPATALDPDEAGLIARCLEGEERAFEDLYRATASRIHGHLCVLLGPGPEAEDALQQTFLEAFRNLRRLQEPARLRVWLHGIAVRVALNAMRSRRRRTKALSVLAAGGEERADGSPNPEARAVSVQQLQQLSRHLEDVPPDRRVAFLLYFVEQLGIAEVGELMGLSPGAAWKRIKRTRDALLEAIAREGAAQGGDR